MNQFIKMMSEYTVVKREIVTHDPKVNNFISFKNNGVFYELRAIYCV